MSPAEKEPRETRLGRIRVATRERYYAAINALRWDQADHYIRRLKKVTDALWNEKERAVIAAANKATPRDMEDPDHGS